MFIKENNKWYKIDDHIVENIEIESITKTINNKNDDTVSYIIYKQKNGKITFNDDEEKICDIYERTINQISRENEELECIDLVKNDHFINIMENLLNKINISNYDLDLSFKILIYNQSINSYQHLWNLIKNNRNRVINTRNMFWIRFIFTNIQRKDFFNKLFSFLFTSNNIYNDDLIIALINIVKTADLNYFTPNNYTNIHIFNLIELLYNIIVSNKQKYVPIYLKQCKFLIILSKFIMTSIQTNNDVAISLKISINRTDDMMLVYQSFYTIYFF